MNSPSLWHDPSWHNLFSSLSCMILIVNCSGSVRHENLYLLWVPLPAGTHGVQAETFLVVSTHGFWLHSSYSSEHPTQSCPSCGSGLSHCRDRCRKPPPHFVEHLPHGPQAPQPGSFTDGGETADEKKKKIRNKDFFFSSLEYVFHELIYTGYGTTARYYRIVKNELFSVSYQFYIIQLVLVAR